MVWVLALAALYVAFLIAIAWFSVHPYRIPLFISPGSLGAPQEEVEVNPEASPRIRGWWVDAPEAKTVAVLAHGYLMNRCELTPVAFRLWQRGVSCLLIDFRAHGRSGKATCSLGHLEREDVRQAVNYARRRCPGAKVILIGSSMGSAASALAMGDDPALADALVLDSSYSDLSEAIIGWWRFLGGKALTIALWPTTFVAMPLVGFNPRKVNVAAALAKVTAPVLVLHGEEDTLALPSEAQRNYDACAGPKEIVWFPKCGHSEGRWIHPKLYEESLLGFMNEHDLL